MPEASSIVCALGPTNTGKTHRALERMLEHPSGMIGLPLRLLAREVYDRLTSRLGETRVALVTGEEKRIPRRPDYWVCTVEAMPLDRGVDFLAVDEIQLAAHRQRGHAFTDRLLRARGRRETWFMGAGTMAPLVGQLLPTARIETYPRLSRLRAVGAAKLGQLPPRTAVVAFSAEEVYALAERLRALRGGAAVVLGALSPRTRNAQVAMFQAGEVDYLVATDAIGMGLNLPVEHVAFASLRKFDGRDVRCLEPQELAQIAGRAGRHLQDGTFGTVLPTVLDPELNHAIESHGFPPLRRLYYRNADLAFTNLGDLCASLRERPRLSCLAPVERADDLEVLERLAQEPDVRARARDPDSVALLWELCQIPDYRKLLLDVHLALVRELFLQLTGSGRRIQRSFLEREVSALEESAGDVEALLARIAAVRTYTYIANHDPWLGEAPYWQQRTHALEERLSDALHERLVQRFVEKGAPGRRTSVQGARSPSPPSAGSPGARGPSQSLASVEARVALPSGPLTAQPFAALSVRRAAVVPSSPPHESERAWADRLVEARHPEFHLDVEGRVSWEGRPLGRLSRGPSLLQPMLVLAENMPLPPGARPRIQRRLAAFARDVAAELLDPLRPGPEDEEIAPMRGLLYQLERGLGCADVAAARVQLEELGEEAPRLLAARGICGGRSILYAPRLLTSEALASRRLLVSVHRGGSLPRVPCAAQSHRAWKHRSALSPQELLALGFAALGPWAVRVDVFEEALEYSVAGGIEDPHLGALSRRLGMSLPQLQSLLWARDPSDSAAVHADPTSIDDT